VTPVPAVVGSYLTAARVATGLLSGPVVAGRWADPSALPGMSVGALAAHLASEVLLVRDVLVDPALQAADEPVPLLEHYRRSSWVTAAVDDDVNVTIRDGAERSASPGHAAVLAEVHEALAAVEARSGSAPAAVSLAWWAWSLSFEDFLVTRMMEIVVHSDDLAVSLGAEPPTWPADVLEPVLALLTGVAVMRHGQPAVVRTLSRAERAPGGISAF